MPRHTKQEQAGMTETPTAQESASAWQTGYGDGYTAVEDGLPATADAPVDGWDGWTINAIGASEFFRLLGDPIDESDPAQWPDYWTPRRRALARAYAQGAQVGAEDCLRGVQR